MNGDERRTHILNTLQYAEAPVSGAALSRSLKVSRQVIVQDIALLRAANHTILSTPKGYTMPPVKSYTRVFHVSHGDEQIADELNTIVDMGGKALDVFIDHEIYGSLRAELMLSSRRDVIEFMNNIQSGKSRPLKNLTSGFHYHTVEAERPDILDDIEKALAQKGYLLLFK